MPFLLLKCNRKLPERSQHCIAKGGDDVIPECDRVTQPGNFTERACSFLGCRVVICNQIKNVIHLVHSPIGCAYYSWDYRPDSYGYCFTTDIQERDVIFGGEKKLFDAIVRAAKEFDCDAIFVYETCTTGLIGDDIQAVARKASEVVGKPVIAFNCAGFRGVSQSRGHKIANRQLFKLIGTGDGDGGDVNLIGDFNAKDAIAIENLLSRIGVKVVCSFTANSTIDRIRTMHKARLNVVHCSRSSIDLAEMMKEKYGIPYINVSFFGIKACCDALRKIGSMLGIDEGVVENVIESCLNEIKPELEYYREKLEGKRVFMCHGVQRVLYLIEPFRELGMEIAGIATYFGKPEDYEEIIRMVGEGTIVIDNPNADELEEILLECKPDLFISDDRTEHLVHKLGIPFIKGRGQKGAYAGFNGFVNFADEVYGTISSRVWKLVRRVSDEG